MDLSYRLDLKEEIKDEILYRLIDRKKFKYGLWRKKFLFEEFGKKFDFSGLVSKIVMNCYNCVESYKVWCEFCFVWGI